jgi:hypothetical protein
MLGELIFEGKGKINGYCQSRTEFQNLKSIRVTGSLEVTETWTYWTIQKLDGTSYGEGQEIMTKDGREVPTQLDGAKVVANQESNFLVVDELDNGLFDKFFMLAELIDFQSFKHLTDVQILWLSALCSEMDHRTEYYPEDSVKMEAFLRRIRSISKMGNII